MTDVHDGDTKVSVRMPVADRDALLSDADRNGRTISEEIRARLVQNGSGTFVPLTPTMLDRVDMCIGDSGLYVSREDFIVSAIRRAITDCEKGVFL